MAVAGDIIFIFLEVLIAVSCCLGNFLVIFVVWKSGALKQPTFCLMVSLAMADFLVGCLVAPLAITEGLKVNMSFDACLFINCVLIVPLQASVFTLLAIAVDRYLRVRIPLRYKSTVTRRRSWILAAVCWMLACLSGFVPMFGWYNHDTLNRLNSTSIDCEFVAVIPSTYLVYFLFFGSFIPPLAVMIALYCYIFFKIRKLSRDKAAVSESGAYNHKEHKLAASLLLVLLLFIACWLPLHVIHTISVFQQNVQVSSIATYAGVLLSHANSMVNPVVYAFRIPKIRVEFRKIWGRLIGQKQQEDKNSKTSEIQANKKDERGGAAQSNQVESKSV